MQIEVNISQRELDRLFQNTRSYSEKLQRVVHALAVKLREFAVQRTPIGEKWVRGVGWQRSGLMKKSWTSVDNHGATFSFRNTVPYANVVEEGLYPGIGTRHNPPRTTKGPGGKIYSTQAIGGIIRPIIEGTAENGMSMSRALKDALRELEIMVNAK